MASLFDGIVQWTLDFNGTKGKLPVFYRDLSSLTVGWTASSREVKKRLPHPDMHPLELFPGKTLAVFTAFEYRDTDIGPYNELSIAFPISMGHAPLPGLSIANALRERRIPAYVWKLPVTTEVARYGGVELYGLPKYLADIKLEQRGSEVECRLAADGREQLSFATKMPHPGRAQDMRLAVYSVKGGIPLVANVDLRAVESGEGAMPEARLNLPPGPVGDELRLMEVGGRALFSVWAPRAQAVLYAPRNLSDN